MLNHVDNLARQGIAYVPFFPLGGFTPLQSSTLSAVADRLGAKPMRVALAWLLHRSANILLIPGTSSVGHLRENLTAGELRLSPQTLAELDGSGGCEELKCLRHLGQLASCGQKKQNRSYKPDDGDDVIMNAMGPAARESTCHAGFRYGSRNRSL